MSDGNEYYEKQLEFNMEGLEVAFNKNDRNHCVMLTGVLASAAKECDRPLLADALNHLRVLLKSEMGSTVMTDTMKPNYDIVKKMYASGDKGENFKDRVMLGIMSQMTAHKGLDVTDEDEGDEPVVAQGLEAASEDKPESQDSNSTKTKEVKPEGLMAVEGEATP